MLADSAFLQGTGIISILVNIAALYMVKDFISSLSKYFSNSADLYGNGSSLMNNSLNRVKKGLGHAVSGTRKATNVVVGAFTAGSRRHKANKDFKNEVNKNNYIEEVKNGEGMEVARKKGLSGEKAEEYAENYAKDAYKKYKKEQTGGTAVGGFFRQAGKGLKDNLGIPVADWLTEKAGMGKASDFVKGIQDNHKTVRDDYDARIKKSRDGEFNEKKLVRELQKVDSTVPEDQKMIKALQVLSRGDYTDKTWDVLKTSEEGKELIRSLLGNESMDLKDVTFSDFKMEIAKVAQIQQMENRKEDIKSGGYSDVKISEEVDKVLAKYTGNSLDRNAAIEYVKTMSDDSNDRLIGSSRGSDSDTNAIIELQGLAIDKQKDDKSRAYQVERITVQEMDIAKEAGTINGSGIAEAMSEAMGKWQADLDKLKDNKNLKDLDIHLTEKLQRLIETQKEATRKFAEAIKNNQQAIVAELKKQKKDKE